MELIGPMRHLDIQIGLVDMLLNGMDLYGLRVEVHQAPMILFVTARMVVFGFPLSLHWIHLYVALIGMEHNGSLQVVAHLEVIYSTAEQE